MAIRDPRVSDRIWAYAYRERDDGFTSLSLTQDPNDGTLRLALAQRVEDATSLAVNSYTDPQQLIDLAHAALELHSKVSKFTHLEGDNFPTASGV